MATTIIVIGLYVCTMIAFVMEERYGQTTS